MPSSYTSSARFTLQATGENNNTWGVILNQGVFQLVDDALCGRLALPVSGAVTLTTNQGATDQARMAFLDFSGAGGNVVIPSVPKGYFVHNAAAAGVTLIAGGAGLSLNAGDAGPVFTDGTTIYPVMIGGKTIKAYVDAGDAASKSYTDMQIAGAIINMPSVVGQAGKLLTTDGNIAYWSGELTGPLQVDGPLTAIGGATLNTATIATATISNTLTVNGSATVTGALTANGATNLSGPVARTNVCAPAALAAGTYNDYNPPGLANASILQLSTSGYPAIITGIVGGYPGRVLTVENAGPNPIQFYAGSYNPTAANQFALFCGQNWSWSLRAGNALTLIYDGAINQWRGLTPGMETLALQRTYYVNASTGNDSNGGLTAATAFQTVQRAVNVVSAFVNLSGQQVIIQCAAGTYALAGGTINILPVTGCTNPAQLTIQGDTTTPSNVVFSNTGSATTLSAQCVGAMCNVQGVTFSGNAGGTYHIYALNGGSISVGVSCVFGAGWNHISVSRGGIVQLFNNYTINGSAGGAHIYAGSGGRVFCTNHTITITGTPSWGTAFLTTDMTAGIEYYGNTFSGAATGQRYNVQSNSIVNTNNGGATYLPGSVAGATITGGQYI